MEVNGIILQGVRTSNFEAIVNLYQYVMGLKSPIRIQVSS
jgi:hypothetical protein